MMRCRVNHFTHYQSPNDLDQHAEQCIRLRWNLTKTSYTTFYLFSTAVAQLNFSKSKIKLRLGCLHALLVPVVETECLRMRVSAEKVSPGRRLI